jgi:hypothetical protein
MAVPTIYQYGSPVIDVTGYSANLVANYRDKSAKDPGLARDHSVGEVVSQLGRTPVAFQFGVLGLGVSSSEPLGSQFERLWGGQRNSSGQTLQMQATNIAVQLIRSAGGTNILGGLPGVGRLLALARPQGGPFLLSYFLPGAMFTFNIGSEKRDPLGFMAFKLTFDIEILVGVPLQDWPNIPQVSGQILVENTNIVPNNPAADWAETAGEILAYVGGSGATSGIFDPLGSALNLQAGAIDATTSPPLALPFLGSIFSELAELTYPLGFDECVVFIGPDPAGTDSAGNPPATIVNVRIVHPVEAGPTLGGFSGAARVPPAQSQQGPGRAPNLQQGPVIAPNQINIPAGGKLVVNGQYFDGLQSNAAYIAWTDPSAEAITGTEIQYTEGSKKKPKGPIHTLKIPRKQYDNVNLSYAIAPLPAGKPFTVQVRDFDLLTYTDPSNQITVQTAQQKPVNLTLQTGSKKVPLGSALANTSGSFAVSVAIPKGTPSGECTITASQGTGKSTLSASTVIAVLGAGESPKPTLFMIGVNGHPMSQPVQIMQGWFTVHGEGFPAGGGVDVAVEGSNSPSFPTVGADGTLSCALLAPLGSFTVVGITDRFVNGKPVRFQATLAMYAVGQPT